jgi:hypothetical protein
MRGMVNRKLEIVNGGDGLGALVFGIVSCSPLSVVRCLSYVY